MNPSIKLILWSIICALLLILIVYLVIKFFRTWRKRSLLLFLPLILLCSCSKNFNDNKISDIEIQKQLISELGFDLNEITIEPKNSSTIQPLVFKSKEEAIQFFKEFHKIKGGTINKDSSAKIKNFNECLPQTKATTLGTKHLIREVFLWANYNVFFNWQYIDSPTKVLTLSDFNSSITGFHLGISWDHLSGGMIGQPGYPWTAFEVYGSQHYNLIIEGIGTLFTQTVCLNGAYNISDDTGSFTIDNG